MLCCLFVGFAQKVDDLFDRKLLKRLAETVQVLVEFDRGVLHALVGAVGTADQKEMFRPGDSMLAVAVETDAEETHDLTFVLLGFGGHRASSLPPGVRHSSIRLYAGARGRVNCKAGEQKERKS